MVRWRRAVLLRQYLRFPLVQVQPLVRLQGLHFNPRHLERRTLLR